MLHIHKQIWLDFTRYLILNEGGSVQLEIYDKPTRDGTRACIWALWVEPQYRGKGLGTALLNTAEEIARRGGFKSVALMWHPQEATADTYNWYLRRGYKDVHTHKDDTHVLKLTLKS